MTKETTSVKSPSGRTRRSDRAIRGPLAVRGKEPGFHYRFVNDFDDNVLSYKEGGYEVVQDKDVSVGDKRVNVPATDGSVRHISVGQGMKAVLMRIPENLYAEDQAIKEERIRAQELAIKKEVLNGNGKFDISRD